MKFISLVGILFLMTVASHAASNRYCKIFLDPYSDPEKSIFSPLSVENEEQKKFREALFDPAKFRDEGNQFISFVNGTGERVRGQIHRVEVSVFPPLVRVIKKEIKDGKEVFSKKKLNEDELLSARFSKKTKDDHAAAGFPVQLAPKVEFLDSLKLKIFSNGEQGTHSSTLENGAAYILHTDIGEGKRLENQDAVFTQSLGTDEIIMGVVDGMGGMKNGREAANIIARSVARNSSHMRPFGDIIEDAIRDLKTYHDIRQKYVDDVPTFSRRYGATVALARVIENQVTFAHMGDAKAVLIRNGKVIFETLDHTFAQALVGNNFTQEDARRHSRRNEVYRAVKIEDGDVEFGENSKPDIEMLRLEPGDVILLASDGVWEHMTPQEAAVMIGLANEGLIQATEKLRKAVKESIEKTSYLEKYLQRKDDNIGIVLYKHP